MGNLSYKLTNIYDDSGAVIGKVLLENARLVGRITPKDGKRLLFDDLKVFEYGGSIMVFDSRDNYVGNFKKDKSLDKGSIYDEYFVFESLVAENDLDKDEGYDYYPENSLFDYYEDHTDEPKDKSSQDEIVGFPGKVNVNENAFKNVTVVQSNFDKNTQDNVDDCQKKSFKTNRNDRIGIAIASGILAVLIAVGVVIKKCVINNNSNKVNTDKSFSQEEGSTVSEEPVYKQIGDVPEMVFKAWGESVIRNVEAGNYVVDNSVNMASDVENKWNMYLEFYNDYLASLDIDNINSEDKERYKLRLNAGKGQFINAVYSLDEYSKEDHSFENSIYAYAITINNENGEEIVYVPVSKLNKSLDISKLTMVTVDGVLYVQDPSSISDAKVLAIK